MKPHFVIALKNISRNKARSIVTILLSSFATAILVFSTALMDGEHKVFLQSAVELYPGYIQVTHKDFKDEPSLDNIILDSSKVVKDINTQKGVELTASRFETFVLFSSDIKSVGGLLAGVEPVNESKVSKLKESLLKGEYLKDDESNSLYIGYELARNLKIDIDDKVSYIGTGADYSFTADNLIVKGIFQTGLFDFDASSAFVSKKYFDEMFVSSGMATHIVVLPKVKEDARVVSDEISKVIPKSLVSKSWDESMEALIKAMELDSIFGYITLGIFFIVIFFVILIYTFISVFARIKEIGILRAIGTKQKEILQMLLFESSVLALVSVIIGGIIGAAIAYYFNINPIDFGSEFDEQFKQYGLVNTKLPTDFNVVNILRDMFIMFILCVASTLYPIIKINKFKPKEAMDHV
ncbi:MAG: FtsX-like permease family protein [Campylobacterota bacterium]|nr:FtsX-like permease family protein [Campylobacterota bacterium]